VAAYCGIPDIRKPTTTFSNRHLMAVLSDHWGIENRIKKKKTTCFEKFVQQYLERTVPHLMLILDPVPIVVEDAKDECLSVPLSLRDPRMGYREL